MNYASSEQRLRRVFKELEYERFALAERWHAVEYQIAVTRTDGRIILSFPGFKFAKDRVDFAVHLRRGRDQFTLSHVNVIVDIAAKILDGCATAREMCHFLSSIAREDQPVVPLPEALLVECPTNERVRALVRGVASRYDEGANAVHLDWDELTQAIFWITLQEEVNYPRPQFLGRAMAFDRYAEAIWASECLDDRLANVVRRAQSRSRVSRLDQVDYYIDF